MKQDQKFQIKFCLLLSASHSDQPSPSQSFASQQAHTSPSQSYTLSSALNSTKPTSRRRRPPPTFAVAVVRLKANQPTSRRHRPPPTFGRSRPPQSQPANQPSPSFASHPDQPTAVVVVGPQSIQPSLSSHLVVAVMHNTII